MPGFSDYLEQQILYWLAKRANGGSFPLPPNNLYISLHNVDPEGTGAGELTTTANADGYSASYARVGVPTDVNAANLTNWSALTAGSPATAQKIVNQNQVSFGVAGSAWNQAAGGGGNGAARAILYFGIWDALTGGNFLGGGFITPQGVGVTINNGQNVIFGAGQLALQLD